MKSHAVTMFEVGKLSDESLDSFLIELEKVNLGCMLGDVRAFGILLDRMPVMQSIDLNGLLVYSCSFLPHSPT